MAQGVPQVRYSTHDSTVAAPFDFFSQGWADVKTPGDGSLYSVGTIEVNGISPPVTSFSGFPVFPAAGAGFGLLSGSRRQVAVLQKVDAATQALTWQRAYYGTTQNSLVFPTNARGVSVWPSADPLDTRIAICGETYDQALMMPGAPLWPSWQFGGIAASGFIAVFDGNGTVLWEQQFFANPPFLVGDCAVTDLSIRVETIGEDTFDVITYCGISSHGSPVGNAAGTLAPVHWFASPPNTCGGLGLFTNGATDNGGGQWDGFVGRIDRQHSGAGTTNARFHAVVGGNQQDGLFGLAELPQDHFIVVGSTAAGSGRGIPAPAVIAANNQFPLTGGRCLPLAPAGDYCLGVIMEFDASATTPTVLNPNPAGNLVLLHSNVVGTEGAGLSTVARDVVSRGEPTSVLTTDMSFVVGSTNDPQLLPAGNGDLEDLLDRMEDYHGGVDGFIMGLGAGTGSTGRRILFATFVGGAEDDELVGVGGWNEFSDHAVALGWTRSATPTPDRQMLVTSLYGYSGGFSSTTFSHFHPLTSVTVGGTGDDSPTAMGPSEVTAGSRSRFNFRVAPLGNHAGGGIAEDRFGRVSAVGTTATADYPITSADPIFPAGRARSAQNPTDATRTLFDLLPASGGRTDATGPINPALGIFAAAPGTNGGTTPPCALQPFGSRVGDPEPPLRRMLIDWEGTPPSIAGASGHVVIMRPPADGVAMLTWLRIGFPGAGLPPLPMLVFGGVEDWIINHDLEDAIIGYQPNSVYQSPLLTLPANVPLRVTIQGFFMLNSPIPAGNPNASPPLPCTGTTIIAGTPALFFDY